MFKDKTIRIGHLIYAIIISVILLSFFLVIAFGGLSNANEMMGTAGTVASIILAVIAIVMSLIDVAGQRQSIVDLKETAKQLKDSNDTANSLIEQMIEKLSEMDYLRIKIEETVDLTSAMKEDIIGKLEELKDSGRPVNEEVINEFKVLSEENLKKVKEMHNNVNRVKDIKRYIIQVEVLEKEFDVDDFLINIISTNYDSEVAYRKVIVNDEVKRIELTVPSSISSIDIYKDIKFGSQGKLLCKGMSRLS